MKTSILICATCLVVTGCSAQLRFPSLSSALSSLTGFGGSSSGGGGNGGQGASQVAQSSSPYSGLVRDYGRNLMMAMSSIYPTLFKPPQAQQQQLQQQSPQGSQSPYDQFGSGQQAGAQSLFSSQSTPSFSFGGSTFSISPSLPFGSLTGASQQQPSQVGGPGGGPGASHSPFSASFGSSINSPSSFGPLSSAPFLAQSMPSFAPASSYNAAFEAANGGGPSGSSFGGFGSGPSSSHSQAGGPSPSGLSSSQLLAQQSNPSSLNSYAPLQGYPGQHDASQPMASQSAHQPQTAPLNQQAGLGIQSSFGVNQQLQGQLGANSNPGQPQYSSQQYRPDMMIAASAPVPSSNSYSNYGNIPSGPSQQVPASSSSYQQPSYR